MVGRASASSASSPAASGLNGTRAKRKRLIHRKKVGPSTAASTALAAAAATTTTAATRRSNSNSNSNSNSITAAASALVFSPIRTRASALAHHVHHNHHHHHYQHSSPILARRSRGDILKPSPKARKLDHPAPPSSAEWSTGSESGSTSSFAPSPNGSPVRRMPRQYPTRRTRLRAAPVRNPLNGKGKEKQKLEESEEDEETLESYDEEEESALSDVEMEALGSQQVAQPAKEAQEEDTRNAGPTDDYLLREASDKQLHRLLKVDLIRVHLRTGIWDDEQSIDPDLYTKDDLIGGIMHWREHLDTSRRASSPARTRSKTKSDHSAEDADESDQEGATTPRASSSSHTRASRQYRRPKRQASSSYDDADTTLLSRSNSSIIHSYKPPTPQLPAGDAEARPAEAFDELNGLDLEGLNLIDKEIHPSKLEKLEKIGSGGFKDVYVGKYQISKARINKVAIADIRDQLTEMDIKELSLLRDLKHENIVRFIGVSIPEEPSAVPVMIVTELCSNGDLFDYIRNTSAPADEEIYRIMLETARGLAYLHTRKPAIIHRDVKSTNVLITRNRTAKINDFGLARVKNSTRSVVRSIVGTVNWQAAELWVPKPHYNEKVDVWSAAMTFWEALQWHQTEKKYPFQDMNEHQIYLDVGQKRQRPYTGSIRRQYGDDIVELLDRMWHHSPRERPTMTEVCEQLEVLIAQKRSSAPSKRSR